MAYLPERGDIVWADFDPVVGHEQGLDRPALVLSPAPFNQRFKLVLVAPITSQVRGHGFEVTLTNCATHGVVLCEQMRTIDYLARGVRFVERTPPTTINDVLAKVGLLVKPFG